MTSHGLLIATVLVAIYLSVGIGIELLASTFVGLTSATWSSIAWRVIVWPAQLVKVSRMMEADEEADESKLFDRTFHLGPEGEDAAAHRGRELAKEQHPSSPGPKVNLSVDAEVPDESAVWADGLQQALSIAFPTCVRETSSTIRIGGLSGRHILARAVATKSGVAVGFETEPGAMLMLRLRRAPDGTVTDQEGGSVARWARAMVLPAADAVGKSLPPHLAESALGKLARAYGDTVERLVAVAAEIRSMVPEEAVVQVATRPVWDGVGLEIDVPWRGVPLLVWFHPEGHTMLFQGPDDVAGVRWGEEARDALRKHVARRRA